MRKHCSRGGEVQKVERPRELNYGGEHCEGMWGEGEGNSSGKSWVYDKEDKEPEWAEYLYGSSERARVQPDYTLHLENIVMQNLRLLRLQDLEWERLNSSISRKQLLSLTKMQQAQGAALRERKRASNALCAKKEFESVRRESREEGARVETEGGDEGTGGGGGEEADKEQQETRTAKKGREEKGGKGEPGAVKTRREDIFISEKELFSPSFSSSCPAAQDSQASKDSLHQRTPNLWKPIHGSTPCLVYKIAETADVDDTAHEQHADEDHLGRTSANTTCVRIGAKYFGIWSLACRWLTHLTEDLVVRCSSKNARKWQQVFKPSRAYNRHYHPGTRILLASFE